MKKIEDIVTFGFLIVIAVLSFLSILGIWDFLTDDVIIKTFQTLGFLSIASVVVLVAGRYMQTHGTPELVPDVPNPYFGLVRRSTLTVLIVSVSLLAILGVLSIWEVVKDKDVLYKSMSSIGVLAFGSFLITVIALYKEGHRFMNRENKGFSWGALVFYLFFAYIVFSIFSSFFWYSHY